MVKERFIEDSDLSKAVHQSEYIENIFRVSMKLKKHEWKFGRTGSRSGNTNPK